MPDPLTLSVMKQIARKAGGEERRFEPPEEDRNSAAPHLTDSQAVLLSELIRRDKRAACTAGTISAAGRTAEAMSLDELVKSTKNR